MSTNTLQSKLRTFWLSESSINSTEAIHELAEGCHYSNSIEVSIPASKVFRGVSAALRRAD